MKKNKRLSHPVLFNILKTLVRPVAYFKWGYRYKDKYKIKKDEKVCIISNHQTDLDPILIHLSFNKLVRCLATDNIFAGRFTARLLRYLGVIPKRKGMVDLKSNMEMLQATSNGDSILFFPEGNRSYAEFQFYISDRLPILLKKFKTNLIIFNLHGGFGKYPRIGSKPRKGKFYGDIKKVLTYEEYKDMPDDELFKIIKDNLKVFDNESGELYKSKARAEYFERLFFVCPKCGEKEQIYSKGNYIRCHNCDLEVEYKEDLSLASKDDSFKFHQLKDWYDYQREYVRNTDFSKEEVIFIDHDVTLKLSNPYSKYIVICRHSDVKLTNTELIFKNRKFDISEIKIASPVSGKKLCFTVGDNNFVIQGDKKFNAIKYVFLFNKLNTLMRNEKNDKYFALEDE